MKPGSSSASPPLMSAQHPDQLRGRCEPPLQRTDLVSCIRLLCGISSPRVGLFELALDKVGPWPASLGWYTQKVCPLGR